MTDIDKKGLNIALSEYMGLKLRIKRIRKGLSLDVVSGFAGICYSSLVNFEKGNTNLNFGMVFRLCFILGVEVGDIMPSIHSDLNIEYAKLKIEYKTLISSGKSKVKSITNSLDK